MNTNLFFFENEQHYTPTLLKGNGHHNDDPVVFRDKGPNS